MKRKEKAENKTKKDTASREKKEGTKNLRRKRSRVVWNGKEMNCRSLGSG